MLCENAYYENSDKLSKLLCKNEKNTDFNGKCPLIYWCKINERYENTVDMFDCIYREKK